MTNQIVQNNTNEVQVETEVKNRVRKPLPKARVLKNTQVKVQFGAGRLTYDSYSTAQTI